ncbi:hypothetical protein CYD53_13216 [Bosea psychrotolerans]|uniref:Uncharacterized protein n=1 Tax=Bosea psychrotolerans TaxID=1871628 RepID=A0A2S4LT13_9HYPH|nr:hypothetical protein CYD53_13216 [Bosea psychrotolerans]
MGGEAGPERRCDEGLAIYDAMGLEAAFEVAGIVEVAGAGSGAWAGAGEAARWSCAPGFWG